MSSSSPGASLKSSLGSSFLAAVIGGIGGGGPVEGVTSPTSQPMTTDHHSPSKGGLSRDATREPLGPSSDSRGAHLPPISPPMSRQPSALQPLFAVQTSPQMFPPRLAGDPADLSLTSPKGLLPPSLGRQSQEVSPGRGIVEALKAKRLSEPSGGRGGRLDPAAAGGGAPFPPSPTGSSKAAGKFSRHSDFGQPPKQLQITG